MIAFIFRRLMATVPVVVLLAIVIFGILRLAPGDPAAVIAGDSATSAQIDQIRHEMQLDLPVGLQLINWVEGLVQGDLGTSLISGLPVSDLIVSRMEPTIAMAAYTILITLLVAIPIGVIAGWKRGKPIDHIVSISSVVGFSVPVFITGYILISIFSMEFRWLPVQGYVPISKGLVDHLKHLILPVAALSTIYIALISRFVRTSMIDILGEDYIRTARSKGVTEKNVLLKHALGNAAVPILTIIGVAITMLIGGVVVTESVFNIPGLGRLVVEAIQVHDYPVIQALIILFSLLDILINLAIDITYGFIDPRITYR